MLIKVTNGRWWYEDKVGEVFHVITVNDRYVDAALEDEGEVLAFEVESGENGATSWILAEDCVEVVEVERKANAGDTIRIKKKNCADDEYDVGDVFTVSSSHRLFVISNEAKSFFNREGAVAHDEYVVLEELQPFDLVEYEEEAANDVVNHPNHYTTGKFEVIEIIEQVTKGYKDPYVGYLVGNTQKYIARAPYKHETPLEDLRKAVKYLEFAIEHLEKQANEE